MVQPDGVAPRKATARFTLAWRGSTSPHPESASTPRITVFLLDGLRFRCWTRTEVTRRLSHTSGRVVDVGGVAEVEVDVETGVVVVEVDVVDDEVEVGV